MPHKKRICYITGSRADFGLMQSTLRAIKNHPKLQLQIIATGMHLDPKHGKSINEIRRQGWKVDATVPWKGQLAEATGQAIAGISRAISNLKSEIVLITGDRVEAFAGAAAAHLSGKPVAHIHGGDRAQGQVDDSLRHAITKLSHIHFPATKQSADRIKKLGEDPCRIHTVGSPGIDGIKKLAAKPGMKKTKYALVILHPIDADDKLEYTRASNVLAATKAVPFERIIIIYPNNDPGSEGIFRCWERELLIPSPGTLGEGKGEGFSIASKQPSPQPSPRIPGEGARDNRIILHRDIPRPIFLSLLRDATVLIGNSSAGIIEAASFGTPVVNIGPRQNGRERAKDVVTVSYSQIKIRAALKGIWNNGRPRRAKSPNPYGGKSTGKKIAGVLAGTNLDLRVMRKLISF